MKTYALVFLAIFAFAPIFFGASAKAPISKADAKILSTNACIDQALVEIADWSQIISLSHYSKDKTSNPFFEQTKKFAFNFADPEEIINFKPDLILTGGFEKPSLIQSANSIGAKIHKFGMPNSIGESKIQIAEIGKLTGNEAKAEFLISKIEALETSENPVKVKALMLFDGGNSAGANTLIDEAMEKSGFYNQARDYDIGNWGKIDLEQMLLNPPDLIILTVAAQNDSMDRRILNHAALKSQKLKIAYLPKTYTYCGGPVLINLLETLQEIRRKI